MALPTLLFIPRLFRHNEFAGHVRKARYEFPVGL